MNDKNMARKPLKIGFVGGGLNSAVGYTHYLASRMDGLFELTSGCFSRNQKINRDTATKFGIVESRCYETIDSMFEAERGTTEVVCILTPTPNHVENVVDALNAGFDVICEKAIATSLTESTLIENAVQETGRKFLAVFNYVGYPMVREAKALLVDGQLGHIQQVYCEMPQESFSRVEANPQAWRRRDYEIPCVSLDLGVHVHHMADYLIGGIEGKSLSSFEANYGKIPDVIDTVHATGFYEQGALMNLMWSKAAIGHTNGLNFKVFAEKGSLEWHQSNPEILIHCEENGVRKTLERGQTNLRKANEARFNRFKAGHPAGFIEAFANVYQDFYEELIGSPEADTGAFGLEAAIEGIKFLESIHLDAIR